MSTKAPSPVALAALALAAVALLLAALALRRSGGAAAPRAAPPPPPAGERPSAALTLTSAAEAEAAVDPSVRGRPTVLLLHAAWCGHCVAMTGAFHDAADAAAGRVTFARVSVEDAGAFARRPGVKGFPTIWGRSADGTVREHEGGRSAAELGAFAVSLVGTPTPDAAPLQEEELSDAE